MADSAPSPKFLTIPTKSSAPISYTFFPAINERSLLEKRLIVFVNGLGLPAAAWIPSITILHNSPESCPAILTYDRFGQGLTTARDPKGEHDFLDVVNDLHEIIISIATSELSLQRTDVENGKLHLLLVGASIGAPISRLYSQNHPGLVAGLILLDSNIANVNYSDIWPDPDAADFDPKEVVSEDCTLEQYRVERNKLTAMFDLNVKNAEGLDRSTGPKLLPLADGPVLVGPGDVGPLLSVVGHDPETFAVQSFVMMKTPMSLSRKLTNA
ncbi:unnamed protein product [Sphagnum balticum]